MDVAKSLLYTQSFITVFVTKPAVIPSEFRLVLGKQQFYARISTCLAVLVQYRIEADRRYATAYTTICVASRG